MKMRVYAKPIAEQAGILELPHARSCCLTEACKILLLLLLKTLLLYGSKSSFI